MQDDKVRKLISVSPWVFEAFTEEAKKNHRDGNGEINAALEHYYKAYKPSAKKQSTYPPEVK